MINTGHTFQIYKTRNVKQIALISFVALLLGHLSLNTYVPNEALNFLGLLITSYFIFHNTLRKNDVFSFLMVMYFCSTVPFLVSRGGGYNMVCVICVILYYIIKNRFPVEKKLKDKWFNLLVGLFVLSSIMGWIFNYTGNSLDFAYSISTFFGIIFLLLISSRIEITSERIKVFLQLNFIIIIYSTIVSINKYLKIITFSTHMMPIYGQEGDYFEGGGLIGGSPLYGEHSLILMILFLVFLIFNRRNVNIRRSTLILAAMLSFINVFMSISRSVMLLSFAGLVLILLFQFKMAQIKTSKIIQQTLFVFLLFISVIYFVKYAGLDYVFTRMEQIENENTERGGVTIERILDGSAFNRDVAFALAKERFKSKNSWLFGYGWGIEKNNRVAFYIDPYIKRGSAHSQIFAILFLFGWIGFIAYWGLLIRVIFKAYKVIGYKHFSYLNRIMAFFSMTSFILFFVNEIKADSISLPTYFAVTIIWMGLAYSSFNYTRQNPQLTNMNN